MQGDAGLILPRHAMNYADRLPTRTGMGDDERGSRPAADGNERRAGFVPGGKGLGAGPRPGSNELGEGPAQKAGNRLSKKYLTGNQIMALCVFMGGLFWFLDAATHSFVFGGGDFIDLLFLNVPAHSLYSRAAVMVILVIFGRAMARIISRLEESEAGKQEAIESLGWALGQVRHLSGLLPICSSCKKIRDDRGYWNQVEDYISTRTDADFTHGICPGCFVKLYPELAEDEDDIVS